MLLYFRRFRRGRTRGPGGGETVAGALVGGAEIAMSSVASALLAQALVDRRVRGGQTLLDGPRPARWR